MELLIVPNELLCRRCESIKDIDDCVVALAEFMLSVLEPFKAVGFSACQFGVLKRLAVIRYQGVELVMINPEIVKQGKLRLVEEECKSIPGKAFTVKRPKLVKVVFTNIKGDKHAFRGHDLLAQVICHEVDHLNGITIDRIGKLHEEP